jgi:hypothetical protein
MMDSQFVSIMEEEVQPKRKINLKEKSKIKSE